MIRIDLGKCTGCRSCETACAFFHSGKVGLSAARVKVLNLYESGIDGPVVCVQCEERYCLTCPDKALSLGKNGEVIVSPARCRACKKCELKCPIGAIEVFGGLTYVCDLCGGSPRCVDACTEGAITYRPEDKEVVSLAKVREKTKRMNPGEKRRHYIESGGDDLRLRWRGEDA